MSLRANGQPWHPAPSVDGVRTGIRKVPAIAAYFWIVKVLTTAMGEVTSDYLVHLLNPIIAVALAGISLAVALFLQFRARSYAAALYWLAVVMVAVFGTMVADVIHVGLGIPYLVSTAGFSVALAATFVAWYRSERTLSIHTIFTRRREAFYWATVMATFALGTAAGDMTASTLGLGYFGIGRDVRRRDRDPGARLSTARRERDPYLLGCLCPDPTARGDVCGLALGGHVTSVALGWERDWSAFA